MEDHLKTPRRSARQAMRRATEKNLKGQTEKHREFKKTRSMPHVVPNAVKRRLYFEGGPMIVHEEASSCHMCITQGPHLVYKMKGHPKITVTVCKNCRTGGDSPNEAKYIRVST